MYYGINFLYSEDRHGIFEHLPVVTGYTMDYNEARKVYDTAVKYHSTRYGNEMIYNKDTELDYNCRLAECMFKCSEPAYKAGYYVIELTAYYHNPYSD